MGQKKISVVDLSATDQNVKVSQKSVKKSPKKAMKIAQNISEKQDTGFDPDMIDLSSIEETETEKQSEEKPEKELEKEVIKKPKRLRGRRYKYARSQIDRTQTYHLDRALELVKKTTISRFDATLSAHLNLKENGLTREVSFPHSTGKKAKVEIVSEELLEKIKKNHLDFDILVTTPEMMPKIAQVAKILGPLGLMPSPKNGNITSDPQKRKAELESGKTLVKSESKNPLMHVVIGKLSQPDKELQANIQALLKAVELKNINKLVLASTMSPGIRVDLTPSE